MDRRRHVNFRRYTLMTVDNYSARQCFRGEIDVVVGGDGWRLKPNALLQRTQIIVLHILYIYFRIEKVVEQSPTPKRKPLLGPSVPTWPPTSSDVGRPKTR